MRIGIDVRCLAEGRRTGVEEYTVGLLSNLFALDLKNEYILFFNSFNNSRADFAWIEKYPNVVLRKFRFPNKLLNFLFWYFGWPKIDEMIGGADVFFMPNIIFGNVSPKARLFLTVHDLSFERYPETFSWKRRLWHAFVNPKKNCQRADKILAVSQSTRDDLAGLYGIKTEKIQVICSGISDKFQVIGRNDERLLQVKEKYGLPYKFILHLGTLEPRKNIIGLVRAFDQMRFDAEKTGLEELAKYKLVIAGTKGWLSEEIFSEIGKAKFREEIQIIHFVADEDKEYLYNLASLFVYPSFFEGFGFPPLEAMACGVPVIVSNSSSLPEIVGSAGIMIDPDKPDEIRRAMKEVLINRELRERNINEGIVRAQNFDWQKSAEEFLKVVEKSRR